MSEIPSDYEEKGGTKKQRPLFGWFEALKRKADDKNFNLLLLLGSKKKRTIINPSKALWCKSQPSPMLHLTFLEGVEEPNLQKKSIKKGGFCSVQWQNPYNTKPAYHKKGDNKVIPSINKESINLLGDVSLIVCMKLYAFNMLLI